MSKLNFENISKNISDGILRVFNNIDEAEEFNSIAPFIGIEVVHRIFTKKNSLPNQIFSTIEDLDNIEGFDQDRFNGLVKTVQGLVRPAPLELKLTYEDYFLAKRRLASKLTNQLGIPDNLAYAIAKRTSRQLRNRKFSYGAFSNALQNSMKTVLLRNSMSFPLLAPKVQQENEEKKENGYFKKILEYIFKNSGSKSEWKWDGPNSVIYTEKYFPVSVVAIGGDDWEAPRRIPEINFHYKGCCTTGGKMKGVKFDIVMPVSDNGFYDSSNDSGVAEASIEIFHGDGDNLKSCGKDTIHLNTSEAWDCVVYSDKYFSKIDKFMVGFQQFDHTPASATEDHFVQIKFKDFCIPCSCIKDGAFNFITDLTDDDGNRRISSHSEPINISELKDENGNPCCP